MELVGWVQAKVEAGREDLVAVAAQWASERQAQVVLEVQVAAHLAPVVLVAVQAVVVVDLRFSARLAPGAVVATAALRWARVVLAAVATAVVEETSSLVTQEMEAEVVMVVSQSLEALEMAAQVVLEAQQALSVSS